MEEKTAQKRKFTVGKFFLYLVLTLLVFACVYPFLNVLAYSFSGYNAVLSGKVTFYPIDLQSALISRLLASSRCGKP